MSFTKAVENRFSRLKKQRNEGHITEEEFLREVEKLQFEDEQGRLWMIDGYSGNWYFEENGQWVSDEPPKFEPEILCSRCGSPVENPDLSMCAKCQTEVAAALATAKSSGSILEKDRREPTISEEGDPDEKLKDVPPADEERGWVSESDDEQRAQFFYDRGAEHFDAKQWQESLDFFEQALQISPAYRDARKLAGVAREKLERDKNRRMVDSKLDMLYERAEANLSAGAWQDAYDLLQEVLSLDSEYRDARLLSEQALSELVVLEERRRQSSALNALFGQGEADFKAGRWEKVIELLAQVKALDANLFADDPRYSQSLDMLAEAEQQHQLETLYAEAVQNVQVRSWGQAAKLLQEVVNIAPDYRDALALLEKAGRQDFIEQQRAKGLKNLEAGRWTEAADALGAVLEVAPDENNVQAGLWYARGRDAMRGEDWEAAIGIFNELMALDASYRDTAAQLSKCKATLRLESAYEAGLKHLEQEHRREALRAFELVVSIDPDYKDVSERLIETRSDLELAELYEQGLRYAEGYRLPEAIAALEQIVAKRGDYRDAADRLAEAKRLRRLADLYSRGMSAFQLGKWSDAIIDFKRVIETDPSYRDAAQRLGEAQRQDRLQDLYKRGLECTEDKDWSRTIEYFEQIVTEDEVYRDAMARLMEARRQRQLTGLYREGEARFAEGAWPEAMTAFEKMLSLDSNDEWGVMARMRESRRQRDLSQMYAQAVHLYDEEKWEEASSLFHQLMEQEPNYQDSTLRLREIDKQGELTGLYARAQEYRAAGQWDAVVETYQRILNIDKEYETVADELEEARLRRKVVNMYQEGQTLMDQQRWARAAEVFERLLALDPGREDVMARLAEAKKQQELADLYSEAVRNLEQNACEDAVQCLERVVGVDASYRDAKAQLDEARERHKFSQFLERGRALYEQGNFEGAIGILRRALEISTDHAEARELLKNAQKRLETVHYYEAGLRYSENKQWDEAIDFLSRVASRDPSFRDAAGRLESVRTQKKLFELYQAAQKALRAKDWQEVVRNLERVVEIDANYKDAAEHLSGAREQIHDRLTAMYNKGKEHLAAGRWQAAINVLEQLQNEAPGFADVDKILREARVLLEQTELAALYEQGMRCMVASDWSLAADYFERIQARAPDYKDIAEQLRVSRQRQLRAYVSEVNVVSAPGSSYNGHNQLDAEADVPALVPQSRERGLPIMTISLGMLGVLVCCVAAVAVVAVVGRSPQFGSQLATLLTQRSSLATQSPIQLTMLAEPGSDVLSVTPVNAVPVPGGPQSPVELITSTLGMIGTPTAVAGAQEIVPTVALDVPNLPTWTPTATPSPFPTMMIATNPDGGEGPTKIRVPPAVQQAMQSRLEQAIAGANVAGSRADESTPGLDNATGADKGLEPAQAPPPSPMPTEEVVAPLSGKIAFSVYEPGPRRYAIYIANVDGSGMTPLLSDTSSPALSVDGKLLAYRSWSNDDRRIMVLDLTTGQFTRLTKFAEDSRPDWSNDGILVFNSTRESDRISRLYTQGFWVGSPDSALLDDSGRATVGDNASWLGLGRIAYSACVDGCGIFVSNADGSDASKIIDTLDRVSLDGAPDGNRIVYAGRNNANWDIFVVGVDGGNDRQLTDDDAADWLPVWSPDGNYIAFVSNRDGGWAIWAVTGDGKNLRKLFDLPGSPDGLVRDEPAWSSQGWIEERLSWAP